MGTKKSQLHDETGKASWLDCYLSADGDPFAAVPFWPNTSENVRERLHNLRSAADHAERNAFVRARRVAREQDPTEVLTVRLPDGRVVDALDEVVKGYREKSTHDEAVRIVCDYLDNRIPFAIYLRSFGVEAQQVLDSLYIHIAPGFEAKFVTELYKMVPVIGIANPNDLIVHPERSIPKLEVPDAEWEGLLDLILPAAHLIFFYVDSITPGIMVELDYLHSHGMAGKTLLIRSSHVDREAPEIAAFDHVYLDKDLSFEFLEKESVFKEMLDRLSWAKSVDLGSRVKVEKLARIQSLADEMSNGGDFETPLALHELLLSGTRGIDFKAGEIMCFRRIAALYGRLGIISLAAKLFDRAYELAEASRNDRQCGLALAEKAQYAMSGIAPEREQTLRKGLGYLERAKARKLRIEMLMAYASVLASQGHIEQSLPVFANCESVCREEGRLLPLYVCCLNAANWSTKGEKLESAENYMSEMLSTGRKLRNSVLEGVALCGGSVVSRLRDRFTEAAEAHNAAIECFQRIERDDLASVANAMTRIHARQAIDWWFARLARPGLSTASTLPDR